MKTIGPQALQILFEHAPDGVFVHDADGRILDVNARACADLGYARSELLAMTVHDIASGATQNAQLWAGVPAGTTTVTSQTARRKDGTTFPVEIRLTCQLVDGRTLFLGFARDVSERVAASALVQRLQDELELRIEQRTRELREARDQLRGVMDSAHDAIVFQDRRGQYRLLNRTAQSWLGMSQADAAGKTALEVFGPDVGTRLQDAEARVMATGQPTSIEERLPIGDQERIYQITKSPHRDASDDVVGLVSIARDITELRRREHEIRQEHGRLTLAARVAGLGIWDYDLQRDALDCDAQWYRIMGRDPAQPIGTLGQFRAFIHPEDVARATEVDMTVAQLVTSGGLYGIEFRIIRPDGEVRWVRSAACLLDDLHGTPRRAVGFVLDVTESRLADERLKQSNLTLQQEKAALSRHSEELARKTLEDPLTGIANRRRLDQALAPERWHSMRAPRPIAFALIDIDFFKFYNDHYGHPQGDVALKAVAAILSSFACRSDDLVARYGGEEFAVLLPGHAQPETVLQAMMDQLARLQIPHAASPISPYLTISCGYVTAARFDAVTAQVLLAQADLALYRAKASGRNRIVTTRL